MYEMEIDVVQSDFVLREGLSPRFLRAPIEAMAPIFKQFPHQGDIRAICPRWARRLIWEPSAREAFAQIRDVSCWHVKCERFRLFAHFNSQRNMHLALAQQCAAGFPAFHPERPSEPGFSKVDSQATFAHFGLSARPRRLCRWSSLISSTHKLASHRNTEG
jgi:hypothetical protein